jgi:ATP-dependent DNA helicase RecG
LLLDNDRIEDARNILRRIPSTEKTEDIIEMAIVLKRAGNLKNAHRLFAKAYALRSNDPKIVHEFAQTKIRLAGVEKEFPVKKRLDREAAELLRRAILLSDDPTRTAWCWYDLARTLNWLREPPSEVEAAYLRAIALRPDEPVIKEHYEEWKRRRGTGQNHQ